MSALDFEELVGQAQAIVRRAGFREPDEGELRELLRRLLYGQGEHTQDRDMWAACEEGLVTERELSDALVGHVYTWAMPPGEFRDVPESESPPATQGFDQALFGRPAREEPRVPPRKR